MICVITCKQCKMQMIFDMMKVPKYVGQVQIRQCPICGVLLDLD